MFDEDVLSVALVALLISFLILFGGFVALGMSADDNMSRQIDHYNSDFSRYCTIVGGLPVIADHDVCFRNNKILYTES